jgi:hypothetical protein
MITHYHLVLELVWVMIMDTIIIMGIILTTEVTGVMIPFIIPHIIIPHIIIPRIITITGILHGIPVFILATGGIITTTAGTITVMDTTMDIILVIIQITIRAILIQTG